MTQMQRPDFLNQAPDLSERAVQGMGSVLPPHVSIRGNQFTLVDGTGNKRQLPPVVMQTPQGQQALVAMDFYVVDVGDHQGKMFFKNPNWTPDSDDPPDCWSTNGVGPSREAINPQARTCAECPNNVRGSRVSNMGSSIKACRDEELLAVIPAAFPEMLFQMKITPGSFKNWRKHVEQCKALSAQTGHQEHIGTVLTRAVFEPGVNGVLVFQAIGYPPATMGPAVIKARQSRDTDLLVGRLDRPRELPPGTHPQQITAPQNQNAAAFAGNSQEGQPATIAQTGFGQQGNAAPQAEPEKRKRRTKAEIAADEAAKQAAQPAPTMAPFRPDATAPAAPGNGAQFGIASNQAGPTSEIEASLNAAFGAPSGAAAGNSGQGSPFGGGFGR